MLVTQLAWIATNMEEAIAAWENDLDTDQKLYRSVEKSSFYPNLNLIKDKGNKK
jgi:hypothetical protein